METNFSPFLQVRLSETVSPLEEKRNKGISPSRSRFSSPHDLVDLPTPSSIPHSSPDHLEIRYRVPFGESGIGLLTTASKLDSLLRLYRFEQIHAAAHRNTARLRGEEVAEQNLRLSLGVTASGELIAVGGVTETTLEEKEYPEEEESLSSPPSGFPLPSSSQQDLLRELAIAVDLSRILATQGGEILSMDQSTMPRILHAGSVASAYRVSEQRKEIGKETERPDLLSFLRSLSEEELTFLLQAFEPVEKAIAELSATLARLEADGAALTTLIAEVEDPKIADVEVLSPAATRSQHRIKVKELAQSHSVESDPLSQPYAPLGKLLRPDGSPLFTNDRFTFSLNGVSITVTKDETLAEVVRRINLGEDENGNGILDSDGQIPPTFWEDADGDGELDGGTRSHDIHAELVGGRLRLTRATPSAELIQVTDPDGFLTTLGLVQEDQEGNLFFPHTLQSPSGATYVLNGVPAASPGNILENAIPGVRIKLLGQGETTFSITSSPNQFTAELNELVRAYNQTITAMNQALSPLLLGSLAREESANRVYRELVNALTAPVPEQPKALATIEDAGIVLRKDDRITFHETQLEYARDRLRANASPILQSAKAPPSVYNSLSTYGISSAESYTATVDAATLHRKLEEDVEALRNLFRRETVGVLARLRSSAHLAIDPLSGTLTFGKRRIEAIRGSRYHETFGRSLRIYEEAKVQSHLLHLSRWDILA